MAQLKDVIWSAPGFEDLKKYCHRTNDFLREVSILFSERAKMEQVYAEGLMKIGSKARKICGDTIGTFRIAWEGVSADIDHEAAIRRDLGTALLEDIAKPLKSFADAQKEARKAVELLVEETTKVLGEKRKKESQAKKSAFSKSKECEYLTVQLEGMRGKMGSEKELSKLDAKCKKAEESVIKCDTDYISKLLEAERSRLELDSAFKSASVEYERLEVEKVAYFKKLMQSYAEMLIKTIPQLDEIYKSVDSRAQSVNVAEDVQTLIKARGTPRQPAEQLVFSCYEQDFTNSMDATRRRIALERKRETLVKALDSELRARQGLDRLLSVYSETPNFGGQGSQQDVDFQLANANAVIDSLEASLYRLDWSLSRIGGYESPQHRLAAYIEERHDKQGLTTFTLRVPLQEVTRGVNNAPYLGSAKINNMNYGPCDSDDDEFDDVDHEVYAPSSSLPPGHRVIGSCMADYEYQCVERDELSIRPGDVIAIIQKHDDGWWRGELGGKIGLFPSSYVHPL